MKIKVTHTFTYDTDDKDFQEEFFEYMGDHPRTMSGLEEFIKDRFINPNFDKGITTMELYND